MIYLLSRIPFRHDWFFFLTGVGILGLSLGLAGCNAPPPPLDADFHFEDPDLHMELVASAPDIVTPIGLAFDSKDALYVLESHTHSPLEDYDGPGFDRVKKGVDTDSDGKPDEWFIFADSLEDGMNLIYQEGLYVSTKNSIEYFEDVDGDHQSDTHRVLVYMTEPEYVYDHAGILGLDMGPDGNLYFSRGNTGGQKWRVVGTDSSELNGYGDGGNVMRCQADGSRLEELATGFWNPFDLRFTHNGRLLLTDNDPDSRGPNRLIEIVPGGQYGYESLYGGSGIHPYLAWNGELPGTLPYAAPLGEAPCSLWDGASTGLGASYEKDILVNIWEENSIVRIPMEAKESSVYGEPSLWLQGGKDFHPVDFATNSRGELYLSDWVLRRYPNHGEGKIWRIRSNKSRLPLAAVRQESQVAFSHFGNLGSDPKDLLTVLESGDAFQQSWARKQLGALGDSSWILGLLVEENPAIRLQGLLSALSAEKEIPTEQLQTLLWDEDPNIRKMTLVYAGKMGRMDIRSSLMDLFSSGGIDTDLFDYFLATLRHLQPEFIQAKKDQTKRSSKEISRELPKGFLVKLISDESIQEEIRSLVIPFLSLEEFTSTQALAQLRRATNSEFQLALIKYLSHSSSKEWVSFVRQLAIDPQKHAKVRVQALLSIPPSQENTWGELLQLFEERDPLLSYALVKHLCTCSVDSIELPVATELMDQPEHEHLLAVWKHCKTPLPELDETLYQAEEEKQGDALRGEIVYESPTNQCSSCHQVNGWGGAYGPDLSHIGSSKSLSLLRNAILNPSAEMSPEWQGWYVVDAEGNRHLGRQIDVHLHSVELMNLAGGFDNFKTPQEYGLASQSLMPEGLELGITPQEFEDLLAYLASLK